MGWWVAHEILVTAQVLGFHLGLDFGLGLVNSDRQTQHMCRYWAPSQLKIFLNNLLFLYTTLKRRIAVHIVHIVRYMSRSTFR